MFELYSAAGAARELGITRVHVGWLIRRGKLNAIPLKGGRGFAITGDALALCKRERELEAKAE